MKVVVERYDMREFRGTLPKGYDLYWWLEENDDEFVVLTDEYGKSLVLRKSTIVSVMEE